MGEMVLGPAPDIGMGVRARAAEVADRIVERWVAGCSVSLDHRDESADMVRRAVTAAVETMGDYLMTGRRGSAARTEQWDRAGDAPLLRHIPLPDVARAYITWRHVCIEVVQEEGAARHAAPVAVEQAVAAVRVGADQALVRMAQRFESTYRGLQVQVAERQAGLEHLTLHDPLTGLANRILLLDRLGRALVATTRRHTAPVVLFLDLDHFKSVNDISGHSVGDQVLTEIAQRLRAMLRPGDTIARMGGDEFVVLCEDLADPAVEGRAVAERITARLEEPLSVDGRQVVVATSIGMAIGSHRDDADAVLRRADRAMYRAKQLGRGRVELYDPSLDRQMTRQADLAAELRHALADGQLQVAFQPVVDVTSQRVVAREALLRWHNPRLGRIAPDEFVPVAEQAGLMGDLGRWVLGRACRACARWRARGEPDVGVTVNVSGRQLQSAHFFDDVAQALESSGLDGAALTLEVTETLFAAGNAHMLEVLDRLRSRGVRISLDDFGTGYSSLSWLARLPLDTLKLDRTCVATIGVAERGSAIVEAMIQLAHTLGLDVVAEGVETKSQLDELIRVGCDHAQGYLLGRPAPSTETQNRLALDGAGG